MLINKRKLIYSASSLEKTDWAIIYSSSLKIVFNIIAILFKW